MITRLRHKALRTLYLIAPLAIVLAAPFPTFAKAPSKDEAALIQRERDYANALIRKDVAFLKDYYAPDWRGGDWMGFGSKSIIVNLLKNKRYVVKSMKLRDLRVRVFGDIGIVQGVDEEISFMGDKDTSGTWGFTDVFARRGGRWVAIASQTTKIERQSR